MKILHVPHAYHPVVGGAEVICQRVSEVLGNWGHEVSVVTSDVSAVQGYYDFQLHKIKCKNEIINNISVERINYGGILYSIAGFLYKKSNSPKVIQYLTKSVERIILFKFYRNIKNAIHRYKPDVIMTMPHLVVNVQAVIAGAAKSDIPIIMVPMLHEDAPDWDQQPMVNILNRIDGVVAMTPYEMERLIGFYGISKEKIFLGGVGVDINDPKDCNDRLRPMRVAFLGRKAKSKGIDILIDAMQVVWKLKPDVELWIAGVRVPETIDIDKKIEELDPNQQRNIRSIETITGDEKREFLRSIRCLVLPSKSESFGMVLLDSWAEQTPVVTWELPLFSSIVDHGVDGLLAKPDENQIDNLANEILTLLENGDSALKMGINGYKKVVNKYDWNSVAKGYLDAYEYVVEKKKTVF